MSVELAAHQQAALADLRHLIESLGGALYADEVGMGKSWVAAALARTWQKRGLRSVFLVPAPLIRQWRDLLSAFFVEAEVRSHESLLKRGLAPDASFVVVDEAHRFRNPATKRYRALAVEVLGRALLLVTATPVVNRADDLLALLRLFAPDDSLSSRGVPSLVHAFEHRIEGQLKTALDRLMVRRGYDILPAELRFGDLTRRVLISPEAVNHDAIGAAVAQLRFPLLAPSGGLEVLQGFLMRRLASSESAFRATLRRQRRFYRRAREALLEGSRVSKADILGVFGRDDEDAPFQDLMFKPLWFGASESGAAEFESIDRELAVIDRALALLSESDSPKADLLHVVLRDEGVLPALLFTGSVATARDLFRRCRSSFRAGLVTSRFSSLCAPAPAEAVFAAFSRGGLDLLIATDVGAEGLNLQRAASVIHYDLPWNPVRIDQRNGRARRIGQTRGSVRAFVFVPSVGKQDPVVATLLRKDVRRRRLLAGRAPAQSVDAVVPTLPPALERAGIRKLWKRALIASGRFDAEWESLLAAPSPAGVDIFLSEKVHEAAAAADQARLLLRRAARVDR